VLEAFTDPAAAKRIFAGRVRHRVTDKENATNDEGTKT
jgi:hypothetical protein